MNVKIILKSHSTKVGEHIPSGISISAILSKRLYEKVLWILQRTRNGDNFKKKK